MSVFFEIPIEIHSRGFLKHPQLEGSPLSGEIVEKGSALSFLSYAIHFYENLRVRDIFKMLVEYPELLVVVPYLDKVVDVYNNSPKIGCASPEVSTVWLCRSTLYAFDEDDSLSESFAFIASEDSQGSMTELHTLEEPLDNWLDCPIRLGLDSLLISKRDQPTDSRAFKSTYTLFDLLLAIPASFTYETGIRN